MKTREIYHEKNLAASLNICSMCEEKEKRVSSTNVFKRNETKFSIQFALSILEWPKNIAQ